MIKVFCYIGLTLIFFTVKGQNHIGISISGKTNLSTGRDITKEYYSIENRTPILYDTRKKYANPFFYIQGKFNYPIFENLDVGIQTGLQFHFNEIHFLGITRTYVAVPIQGTLDYKFSFLHKKNIGISFAAGVLLYNINDYVYKIKNASLFDANVFYNIDRKHRIFMGVEKQVDYASFHFQVNNPNSKEIFPYHLNRLSIFLGYTFQLKTNN